MTWKAKLWKVALLPSKEASTFLLKKTSWKSRLWLGKLNYGRMGLPEKQKRKIKKKNKNSEKSYFKLCV
jgi:hypothetical protein